jgi:hypothetical protein
MTFIIRIIFIYIFSNDLDLKLTNNFEKIEYSIMWNVNYQSTFLITLDLSFFQLNA